MYNLPNLEKAVKALEYMRKVLFEDWMTQSHFDFVVFPAAGDVGFADSDVDVSLAEHTWKNGVKYSNGNRALRHLGIPSVTVTMGLIQDKNMPMGLTFLGRAYEDIGILKAGYAYELQRQRRTSPPLTPPLISDNLGDKAVDFVCTGPELLVTKCSSAWILDGKVCVSVEGTLSFPQMPTDSVLDPELEIYIDAAKVSENDLKLWSVSSPVNANNVFGFSGSWSARAPPDQDRRNQVTGRIARDSTMIIVLARNGKRGWPSGCLRLIHVRDAST